MMRHRPIRSEPGPRTWLRTGVRLGLEVRMRMRARPGPGLGLGMRLGFRVRVGPGLRFRVRMRLGMRAVARTRLRFRLWLWLNRPEFDAHRFICFRPIDRCSVHSSQLHTRPVVSGRVGA